MTTADTNYAAPGTCCRCGGPCAIHKGSVHGWTCTACLDAYLDESAAKWEARSEKSKERIRRNSLHGSDIHSFVTADRRQEGGGSALCTAPPSGVDHLRDGGVIPTGEDNKP